MMRFLVLVSSVLFLFCACVKKSVSSSQFEGTRSVYSCDKSLYGKGVGFGDIVFTELKKSMSEQFATFLISDTLDTSDPAGLIFVVDKVTHRVDQIRKVSGEPFEDILTSEVIPSEMTRSRMVLEFGKMILEDAVIAVLKVAPKNTGLISGPFTYKDRVFLASGSVTINENKSLPKILKISGKKSNLDQVICEVKNPT